MQEQVCKPLEFKNQKWKVVNSSQNFSTDAKKYKCGLISPNVSKIKSYRIVNWIVGRIVKPRYNHVCCMSIILCPVSSIILSLALLCLHCACKKSKYWKCGKATMGRLSRTDNIVIYSLTWKDINLARRAGGQYQLAPFLKIKKKRNYVKKKRIYLTKRAGGQYLLAQIPWWTGDGDGKRTPWRDWFDFHVNLKMINWIPIRSLVKWTYKKIYENFFDWTPIISFSGLTYCGGLEEATDNV